jgi:hypothetical protein
MSEERHVFHIRINGGPEQRILTKSGVYVYAVAAVPALFDTGLPVSVEIWVPRLLPEYGPYSYRVETDEFGNPVVRHDLALELERSKAVPKD